MGLSVIQDNFVKRKHYYNLAKSLRHLSYEPFYQSLNSETLFRICTRCLFCINTCCVFCALLILGKGLDVQYFTKIVDYFQMWITSCTSLWIVNSIRWNKLNICSIVSTIVRLDKLIPGWRFLQFPHTSIWTLDVCFSSAGTGVNVFGSIWPWKYSKQIKYLLDCFRRMNKNIFRDRRDYFARVAMLPMFIIFILLMLGRLKHTQSSIHDRIGLLYQSCAVPTFIGVINAVPLCKNLIIVERLQAWQNDTLF